MKKIVIILFTTLILLGIEFVHGTESTNYRLDPRLYYLKLGPGYNFDNDPFLSLGIGGRHRINHHGIDLSLMGDLYSDSYFHSKLRARGLYLYYPYPQLRNGMYFGVGGGYGFDYLKKKYGGVILGLGSSLAPSYSRTWTTHFLTVDSTVGYEFRRDKRFKPFLEAGLAQPVLYLNNKKNHKNWDPAITVSLGLGW